MNDGFQFTILVGWLFWRRSPSQCNGFSRHCSDELRNVASCLACILFRCPNETKTWYRARYSCQRSLPSVLCHNPSVSSRGRSSRRSHGGHAGTHCSTDPAPGK